MAKLKLPNGTIIELAEEASPDPLQGATAGLSDPAMAKDVDDPVRAHMHERLMARAQWLEMLAAAFLKQVGSARATDYELVESYEQGKIKWYFEKKKRK